MSRERLQVRACLLLVLNSYSKHATCLHSHFFLFEFFSSLSFALHVRATWSCGIVHPGLSFFVESSLTWTRENKHALEACLGTHFKSLFLWFDCPGHIGAPEWWSPWWYGLCLFPLTMCENWCLSVISIEVAWNYFFAQVVPDYFFVVIVPTWSG